jgi:hypothetical protein
MSALEHFDDELLALEERIKRLGIACGVDLAQKNAVVSVIMGDFGACRHGDMPKREELRALLMMKYQIQTHCIDALGAGDCLKIVEDIDARLARRGFRK